VCGSPSLCTLCASGPKNGLLDATLTRQGRTAPPTFRHDGWEGVTETVAGRNLCQTESMAHHKRKRPKHRRNGCLLCKPHKLTANVKAERRRGRREWTRHEEAAA
jgi:hypothetical protein